MDRRDHGDLSTDEYLCSITTKVLTDEQRRCLDDKISTKFVEIFQGVEILSDKQNTRK